METICTYMVLAVGLCGFFCLGAILMTYGCKEYWNRHAEPFYIACSMMASNRARRAAARKKIEEAEKHIDSAKRCLAAAEAQEDSPE